MFSRPTSESKAVFNRLDCWLQWKLCTRRNSSSQLYFKNKMPSISCDYTAVVGAPSRSTKVKGERAFGPIRTWRTFLPVGPRPICYGQPFTCYMGEQKLSWPSFDLLDVMKVTGHAGFWIIGIEFSLVSPSNYGSNTSFRLYDLRIIARQTTDRQTRTKGLRPLGLEAIAA